ncbi:MAG: UDP-N-acetylglucosamine 2-epimerase (non-hydrolyzing), partial [Bacteroidota bacterium]
SYLCVVSKHSPPYLLTYMNQKSMKIISVVGARPNFMKVAPLHRAFQVYSAIESKIVHTGQHYDERMSSIFFEQLELPKPDYYLGIGSGSHAEVTAKVMVAFEKIVLQERPDLVIVVGDVNSTLACAIVTKKLNIQLAHVEAGLRSGDRTMPEELNRIMTDSIADYFFVTEQSGITHLTKEGVNQDRIHLVGNVMIDSLLYYLPKASKLDLIKRLNLTPKNYVLVTMHRPFNVDEKAQLSKVVTLIKRVGEQRKVVFPIHPRTLKRLHQYDLFEDLKGSPHLLLLEPQGYLEFICLMENSEVIITDSGGVQEESTFLQVPCLTIRGTTERPITTKLGTNILIPRLDVEEIIHIFHQCLEKRHLKEFVIPPLWDGKAAERIAAFLFHEFCNEVFSVNQEIMQ